MSDALKDACRIGDVEVVDRLLRDGVDPSFGRNVAIGIAAALGHVAVVSRLMQDSRVEPADYSNWSIVVASLHGHLDVVDRLLTDARVVTPPNSCNSAFAWALQQGHHQVAERLLEGCSREFLAAMRRKMKPEIIERFEYRTRFTEICIALQSLRLPAWVTMQILKAVFPFTMLPIHCRWALVCAVKHFRE